MNIILDLKFNNMYESKLREVTVSYSSGTSKKLKLSGSNSAYKLIKDNWNLNTVELQEEFKILLLNRANMVLGIHALSKGGVSGTLVDPKLVFGVALKCNASAIILTHNHPSGNLHPSISDKNLTKKLVKAGKFLDIIVLDHIIVTLDGYLSFADENILHA